jgi:dipeptidase
LLETYGQDACGGYKDKKFYYHNSFLIADTQTAWVLETAGKEWAVQQVHGSRSISNRLSIVEADLMSSTAQLTAKIKGWWDGQSPFHFQEAYTDWLYTRVGRAAVREACTLNLVNNKAGQLRPEDCMEILQTHNVEDRLFKPRRATTASVCMHATGLLNPSQTTGSMVSELRKDQPHTVWLTGTSMPCLSVYIPFYFGTSALDNFLQPTAQFDASLWWRAERLHRWISKDYMSRKLSLQPERLALQQSFFEQDEELMRKGCSMEELGRFSTTCLARTNEALARWSNDIKS